jgi:hypothetical protein
MGGDREARAKPQASRVNLTVLGQLAFELTFWRRICGLLFQHKDGPTLTRHPISSGTGSLLVSMTWLLKSWVPFFICSPLAVPWSRARAGAVAGRCGGGRVFAR